MFATGLVTLGIVREGFGRDAELLRHIGDHRSGRDFTRLQGTARHAHIEKEHSVAEPGGIAGAAAHYLQDVPGLRSMPTNPAPPERCDLKPWPVIPRPPLRPR